MATIDVGPGHLTLDEISSAAGPELAADPLVILPAPLAAAVGGAVISHVRVRVDLTARRLTAVGLDVVGDRPWPLLPGRLAVTDLNPSVNVYSHGAGGGDISGALTGTMTLGGTAVPVVASPVRRDPAVMDDSAHSSDPRRVGSVGRAGAAVAGEAREPVGADAGWWSVVMDPVDRVPLSSLGDLAGLLGDDGIDSMLSHAQSGAGTPRGPTAAPRHAAVDSLERTPPVLAGIAIDLASSGIVDAVAITLELGSTSPGSGDGSSRRTVVVDRQRRAERFGPAVSVTTEGRER